MGANGYNGQQSGDLRATLAVSRDEAAYGTTRMLNLPDGRTIQVIVPPNTHTGQEIQLEGLGQSITAGGPLGALILTIAIAQSENFGSQPYPLGGTDTPTEFIAPPPPPPPTQASYSGLNQTNNFTNYPPQGQTLPPPVYPGTLYANQPVPQQANTPFHGAQGYPPVAPLQNKRTSRRPLLVTLAIAVLAVLVIVGSLIYYGAVYQPQQQHVVATAVAQVKGTSAASTAQVAATNTTQLNATATAVAQPRIDYATITAKTPDLLNDPLTNPDTYNWDTNANCSFKGGSYHVTSAQNGFFNDCAARNTAFSHFLFQVKMTFLKGDYGGILFRADLTNSKFYLLRIDRATGGYDLYIYTGNKASDAKRLLSSTTSVLNTDLNQTNQIAVLARGQTLSLYFNSTYIDKVNDATVPSGEISLFAEDNGNPAELSFQQAQVWNA